MASIIKASIDAINAKYKLTAGQIKNLNGKSQHDTTEVKK